MRILWVCNKAPEPVVAAAGIEGVISGGWLDSTAADLLLNANVSLKVLFLGGNSVDGALANLSFASFSCDVAEDWFYKQIVIFQPDVIHIWGTEFPHSLEVVRAANKLDLLGSTVVSIQGLVSICGRYHYAEGISDSVMRIPSFGDFVRGTSLDRDRRTFLERGEAEQECLRLVKHVIGRTEWDRACAMQLNPGLSYHYCNESLRPEFYDASWSLMDIERHSIFVSQCSYPIKGFHYALQALSILKAAYPDVVLYTTGESVFRNSLKRNLGRNSYQAYIAQLIDRLGLRDNVHFVGTLDAAAMRDRYLASHVFVSSSTIENSPNSVGEAMLLGCPVVSSNVGGVSDMLTHGKEGFLYQESAPYMLAWYVSRLFDDDLLAKRFSNASRNRAVHTHDRTKNLNTMMGIYKTIRLNHVG
ncbi:glycosyltransferase family 4 protein [Collinsella sp. D33t1_170424_A12]|uniref:glycosyltransferase family 4 protein n=1 Tax=Collinsella sp. D33t1_170424_A12 TaxID=2787135 RepID=UPI001897049C|nr:glycosyltransferase family 4 protein [Collinsella sp. D33t1_170424_A12]